MSTKKKAKIVKAKGTEKMSGLQKMVINCLNRYMWQRWPARTDLKKKNRVEVQEGHYKNGNPLIRVKFRCDHCKGVFKEVEVDHKDPRIEVGTGFVDLDTWVNRTFVGKEKLQVLCEACHEIKTSMEQTERAKARKND